MRDTYYIYKWLWWWMHRKLNFIRLKDWFISLKEWIWICKHFIHKEQDKIEYLNTMIYQYIKHDRKIMIWDRNIYWFSIQIFLIRSICAIKLRFDKSLLNFNAITSLSFLNCAEKLKIIWPLFWTLHHNVFLSGSSSAIIMMVH